MTERSVSSRQKRTYVCMSAAPLLNSLLMLYYTVSCVADPFDDAATNTRMGRCNQAAHQIPPTPPPQFHESVPYSSAMQPRGGVPMPRTQPPMFHAQPNTQPQPASTPSMQQQVARHQRVLLFLRHCAKCTDPSRCSYGSKCQIGKQLWSHIFHCSNPHCTYRNCVYSRELLRHYQKCVDKNCPICGPVRAYVANDRGSNGAPLCPF